MNKYKAIIIGKNIILIIVSLFLFIITESKGFNLYKDAYIFNVIMFGASFFWIFTAYKIVPDSGLSPKAYMQVTLSFIIFIAPLIDYSFDRVFTKASTILFVLALSDGFYFVWAIILNAKKKLESPKVKELLSEIFSNQKSN
ncbi:hypothetical protein ACAX46_004125 [Providencia rettgeri]